MDPSPPGKINTFDFCKVWVCTCTVKSKNIIVEMYNEKCKMQKKTKPAGISITLKLQSKSIFYIKKLF